jgi:hypothetical protein
MKDIMELSKALISYKLFKSMEKSKSRFGDAVTIFHHHH